MEISPPNTPAVYWVARRTANAKADAEAWADGQPVAYWEVSNGEVSVHWVKVDGLAGWYLLNDAALYVLSYVADEEAEAQGDYELLGWECEEVGQIADAQHVPAEPPAGRFERVAFGPLLAAMRQLRGPGHYEDVD